MIRVRQDKEDILQYGDEELLEEHARRSLVRHFSHVVHKLVAHAQASVFDFAVVVLARPHARIDDEFELAAIKS